MMQYMVMYIYIFTFHLKTVESSDNSVTRISIVVLPVKIMHWNCDLHQSSRSQQVQGQFSSKSRLIPKENLVFIPIVVRWVQNV